MNVNFIYQKPNCLSDENCDNIIKLFEELKKYQRLGGTTDGVNQKYKKSTDLVLNIQGCECFKNEQFKSLMQDLMTNLGIGLQEYKKQYTIDGIGIDSVSKWGMEDNFNIQRYLPKEGYYVWHTENSGISNSHRILAWMIYLNDVTDAGGTEFLFQNITLPAKKGNLVIWPADWTHYHRGEVSNTQTKYIVTGWFRYIQ
jgi:hypothetical protein